MAAARDLSLLSALSDELSRMTGTVEGLSDLLMDHARLAAPADRPQVLTRAQDVDELGQRIHALRNLTLALANEQPLDAVLDAVPLADLADRLRGAVLGMGHGRIGEPAVAGDLMLFD